MKSGERIENAIRELKLSENEIKVISFKNLNKICEIANVEFLELMIYLRSRKGREVL